MSGKDLVEICQDLVLLHEHHVQLVLVRLAEEGLAGAVSFVGCLKGLLQSESEYGFTITSLVAWNVVINDDDFPLLLDTVCKTQIYEMCKSPAPLRHQRGEEHTCREG